MTVRLRQVEHEDSARLLAWRNSPEVAAYMYNDHRISQLEHDRWFAAALTLEDRRYWIIEMDGEISIQADNRGRFLFKLPYRSATCVVTLRSGEDEREGDRGGDGPRDLHGAARHRAGAGDHDGAQDRHLGDEASGHGDPEDRVGQCRADHEGAREEVRPGAWCDGWRSGPNPRKVAEWEGRFKRAPTSRHPRRGLRYRPWPPPPRRRPPLQQRLPVVGQAHQGAAHGDAVEQKLMQFGHGDAFTRCAADRWQSAARFRYSGARSSASLRSARA